MLLFWVAFLTNGKTGKLIEVKMTLSVVIPSYNETENLKRGVLDDVNKYLQDQKYPWEVIVSDDGSPDELGRTIAKEFCEKHKGFRFLENEHAGKPFAIWSGIKAATGDVVLFADMDQSTPMKEVSKLLPFYEKGFDVVIGSRGTQRKDATLFRKLASGIFREIRRAVLLRNIIDTQAGFKSCRLEVAKKIFPLLQVLRPSDEKVVGWKVTSYDVEFLFAAQKHGYKIAEVEVEWAQRDLSMDVKKSSDKGRFIKESLDMLKELWRVKTNDLRGYYN